MHSQTMGEATVALGAMLKEAGDCGTLVPGAQDTLAVVERTLALPPLLRDFYCIANPVDVEIPWLVERLLLFPLDKLEASQEGYSFPVGHPRALALGWSPEWIVIGNCSGDPIIVDAKRPGSPVLMARHGVGSWAPTQVSASLTVFIQVLAEWLSLWLSRKGDIRDGGGVLRPEVVADFANQAAEHLSEPDRKSLMSFVE